MTIDFEKLAIALEENPSSAGDDQQQPEQNNDTTPGYRYPTEGEEPPEEDPAANLPAIVDAATFVAEALPPPPELIKGLVHQGTKVVIGGGSKSFKTWVQLDAALSVAYGLNWLGFETVPGKVLFVNFEIAPFFFQKRVAAICDARGIQQLPERLDIWNLRGFSAPYKILIPQIISRIKDKAYSLVVLDPIYKLYGNTDENSAHEVAQLLNELERVCVETLAAIMFGAHYSKGNQAAKEAIDRVSGSGVFARDPDSIIPFTRHEEQDAFSVEPILRNLPPIDPIVVRWNYPLMERDEDLNPESLKQPGKPGRKKEYDPIQLLIVIKDRTRSNPISMSEWAKLAGVKRQTLNDYMDLFRSSGYINTVGEGTSARKFITRQGLEILPGFDPSTPTQPDPEPPPPEPTPITPDLLPPVA